MNIDCNNKFKIFSLLIKNYLSVNILRFNNWCIMMLVLDRGAQLKSHGGTNIFFLNVPGQWFPTKMPWHTSVPSKGIRGAAKFWICSIYWCFTNKGAFFSHVGYLKQKRLKNTVLGPKVYSYKKDCFYGKSEQNKQNLAFGQKRSFRGPYVVHAWFKTCPFYLLQFLLQISLIFKSVKIER